MKTVEYLEMLIGHVKRAFTLTRELVQNLSIDDLRLALPGLPSNTMGEQLWCMIGARESYLKAIVHEKWSGFGCSLTNHTSKDEVLRCLEKSSQECLSFLEGRELSATQTEFLMNLLEHEIQHHGQLIRYVYGNKRKFPPSWHERYTV